MEPRPCNFALFELDGRRWHLVGRYPSPQVAVEYRDTGIVIDTISNRVVWRNGVFCSRQKPATIPQLPIEKYPP